MARCAAYSSSSGIEASSTPATPSPVVSRTPSPPPVTLPQGIPEKVGVLPFAGDEEIRIQATAQFANGLKDLGFVVTDIFQVGRVLSEVGHYYSATVDQQTMELLASELGLEGVFVGTISSTRDPYSVGSSLSVRLLDLATGQYLWRTEVKDPRAVRGNLNTQISSIYTVREALSRLDKDLYSGPRSYSGTGGTHIMLPRSQLLPRGIPSKVGVIPLTGDESIRLHATAQLTNGLRAIGFKVSDVFEVGRIVSDFGHQSPDMDDPVIRSQLAQQLDIEGVFVGSITSGTGLFRVDSCLDIRLLSIGTGEVVWRAEAHDPRIIQKDKDAKVSAIHTVRKALSLLETDLFPNQPSQIQESNLLPLLIMTVLYFIL